jgi:hypothetical protein
MDKPEVASLDDALAMAGTGWEGDLDAMRESRVVDLTDADAHRLEQVLRELDAHDRRRRPLR